MRKIPYGILNYKVLIDENYQYVDKTMYLEKLESLADDIVLFTRPRTFGKSLFTSMMYYYYDVNSKCLFEPLFKDTYVYKNPTPYKNSYYILKFDFSGITTADKKKEELKSEFKAKVKSGILNFCEHYNVKVEINYETLTANRILLEFFTFFVSLQVEQKLYILIDEYDNFTNAILEGEAKDFINIVGDTGFVKTFYAQMKEYVGLGVVDRVFITGICPITMDSMTTGFNIATDISLDPRFSSMIGLTHEEVKDLLIEVEEEKREELYEVMIENYDGYLFSAENIEHVFNATLVMYFLKNYYDFNKIPKELIDKNILVNYGKIENLVKLQNNKFYVSIIDSLLTTEEISGKLKTSFNLKEEFTKEDIISLLYYFGYLTIKEEKYGSVFFQIPNYVMKETYYYYFLKLLSEENITIDTERRVECIKEIVEERKIHKLTDYVSEILHLMDNRNFENFRERNIQNIYFATLLGNSELDIRDEYPCLGGYVDLFIEPKRNKDYSIMIELKYIKKKDFNKKVLEEKASKAKSQLEEYASDERVNKETLAKFVVVFVGCDVKLIEEV